MSEDLARSIVVTVTWLIGWAALLLLVSVLLSACATQWRQDAAWCGGLSAVVRRMAECAP